jgi:hypothetical protein
VKWGVNFENEKKWKSQFVKNRNKTIAIGKRSQAGASGESLKLACKYEACPESRFSNYNRTTKTASDIERLGRSSEKNVESYRTT